MERMPRGERNAGVPGTAGGRRWRIVFPVLAWAVGCLMGGCDSRKENHLGSVEARALFEQATKEFHNPSSEAHGAEKGRLLREAAVRYERLLKEFPHEKELGAQAELGLASVCAMRGETNDAVRHYVAVGEKYPDRDWEVLQAWKSAGDLLWDTGRHAEAKDFYAKLVHRFDTADAPMVTRTVVRGAKSKLAQ